MTDPQVKTLQYRDFLSNLNKALPFELEVRAINRVYPKKMEKLRGIDAEIRAAWTEYGFNEAEVEQLGLAELSWDFVQLGWSERRQPFERFAEDILDDINAGLQPIHKQTLSQVTLADYPFARRHRYADLVRCMDVGRVLRDYLQSYDRLRRRDGPDGIPIGDFILSFKAPIAVIPGALQRVRLDGPQNSEYLGLMLRYDMPLEDVHAALLDFQHHYAEFRLSTDRMRNDPVASRLLDPWGDPAKPSRDELVKQAHQIHPKLAGLYCYDRFVAHGGEGTRGARVRAIKDTIAQHLYSTSEREENSVGKWFDTIKEVVDELAKEFAKP